MELHVHPLANAEAEQSYDPRSSGRRDSGAERRKRGSRCDGAVTGELNAPAIALVLYGTADSDKLTASQKENLSALATLASGIAAGVGSGSAPGAGGQECG